MSLQFIEDKLTNGDMSPEETGSDGSELSELDDYNSINETPAE